MMKSVKEIIANDPSPWSGSEITASAVRSQILERWGPEEAKRFNPLFDARTFKGWLAQNFCVNKNEKGLKSFVILEKKDKNGKVIKKVPKSIWLFHKNQVSPLQ